LPVVLPFNLSSDLDGFLRKKTPSGSVTVEMVNREICGNSPKPPSDSVAISQLRETFVRLNEDLLGNVFRIGQVPDYPGRDRKYHILVVPDKCFKFPFLRHFSVQPTTRPLVEMG